MPPVFAGAERTKKKKKEEKKKPWSNGTSSM
jgi:hypothetical protein